MSGYTTWGLILLAVSIAGYFYRSWRADVHAKIADVKRVADKLEDIHNQRVVRLEKDIVELRERTAKLETIVGK